MPESTLHLQPEHLSEDHDAPIPVGPPPALSSLTHAGRQRIVRFIATSALGGGVAPTEVIALYADLAGEPEAILYVDQRFVLRELPSDWRAVEDRVLDLEDLARSRGVDLAAAWRRVKDIAPGFNETDALEDLARLAGMPGTGGARSARSIFDDPDDLDGSGGHDDSLELHQPLAGRAPDLVDLDPAAQLRIRRFAIEERLERGLAPIELLDLYRAIDDAGDLRAHQYLDRTFVDRDPPPDWLDLQAEAQKVLDLAQARGRDAGRLFSTVTGGRLDMDPLVALQMVVERLRLTSR